MKIARRVVALTIILSILLPLWVSAESIKTVQVDSSIEVTKVINELDIKRPEGNNPVNVFEVEVGTEIIVLDDDVDANFYVYTIDHINEDYYFNYGEFLPYEGKVKIFTSDIFGEIIDAEI